MEQRKESFDRLGKNFQEKLCQLMLEDRPFCDQIEEVLNINFFEKAYLRAFSKIILDYREQYKNHPTYISVSPMEEARLLYLMLLLGWFPLRMEK